MSRKKQEGVCMCVFVCECERRGGNTEMSALLKWENSTLLPSDSVLSGPGGRSRTCASHHHSHIYIYIYITRPAHTTPTPGQDGRAQSHRSFKKYKKLLPGMEETSSGRQSGTPPQDVKQ